ncbi:MAG: hypothetical protein H2070_05060 [Congregibacter sp.]|nr:hypothetical protein [Congregibacter sp.]
MDASKTAGQAPLAGNKELSGFSEDHLAMSTEPTELNARRTDAADAKEVSPVDIDEAKTVAGRRRFLRWFGVSASGVALANTIDTSKEKIEAGGERAQEEIARLKKAYQELDDRSRLILKLILILSGLDFITAL